MRIIGLCGRSGSGKGIFSSVASKHGIKVIDCDAVYKDMVSRPTDCLKEIETEFGSSVINNNSLDRRTLAKIVFSDPEKLEKLNEITHKYILSEVGNIITSSPDDSVILIDAPTMFESGCDALCDVLVGVIASDNDCISRIMQRDGISETDAKSRLDNQYTNDFIKDNCDVLIYNESTLTDFENDSDALIQDIIKNTIM